jgi:hypothetical protein
MSETLDLNWPATVALSVPIGTIELIAERTAQLMLGKLEKFDDEDLLLDVHESSRFLGISPTRMRDLVREDAVPFSRSELLGKKDGPLGFAVVFSRNALRAWKDDEYDKNSTSPEQIAERVSWRRKQLVDAITAAFLSADESLAGCVYFCRSSLGGDLVKIGYTTNLGARMSDLKAEPLLAVPGTRDEEARLHKLFAAARVHGEWFRPVPELLRYIERLRENSSPEEVAA